MRWFWGIVAAALGFFVGKKFAEERQKKTEKKPVTFTYVDSNAKSVSIVGDFNNWDEKRDPMFNLGGGVWQITLYLEPGEYEYKFVIDGEKWIEDPNAKKFVDDGKGRRSIVTVE